MSRCFKALPLALALAALSIVTASCGSSSNVPAQARFVNAIPDTAQYGTALDIDVAGTKEFTDVPFPGFQPSSGYTKIVSGGSALQGIQTGTTIPVFVFDISLTASAQYTLVATGSAAHNNVVPITALDNNLPPPNGQEKFRVINASPSRSDDKGGAVDIYIVPVGSATPITPPATISNVHYPSASTYAFVDYNPNFVQGFNYTMFVTLTGTTSPILFSQTLSAGSSSAGSIRTLVLTDQQNISQLNPSALVLNDLN
jgi:Domain of unknown function (DUF4397)